MIFSPHFPTPYAFLGIFSEFVSFYLSGKLCFLHKALLPPQISLIVDKILIFCFSTILLDKLDSIRVSEIRRSRSPELTSICWKKERENLQISFCLYAIFGFFCIGRTGYDEFLVHVTFYPNFRR